MRRYKYLEKMFEEEMKKVLIFIKGFTPSERLKLARMTGLWIGNGSVPPTVLNVLINEHLVKDGIALDFLVEVLVTIKQEKGLSSLTQTLKKGSLEARLMEFLPMNKRNEEYLKSVFMEKGLTEIVKLHKNQASQEAKRELQQVRIEKILIPFIRCVLKESLVLIFDLKGDFCVSQKRNIKKLFAFFVFYSIDFRRQ